MGTIARIRCTYHLLNKRDSKPRTRIENDGRLQEFQVERRRRGADHRLRDGHELLQQERRRRRRRRQGDQGEALVDDVFILD